MVRILLVLFIGGCLTGCAAKDDAHFQRQLQWIDKLADVAEKTESSFGITATFDGNAEAYQKVSFGLGTGTTIQVHLQGNAQNTEASE